MNDIFKDEKFLNSVLDTMTDGLMVVDKDGTILSFNKAAERMTGYSASEILGKNCEILDTDTCMMDGERKNCSLFEEGRVTRKGCRIKAKDGGVVHLLKNAVVLRNEKGDVIGGVETMTDITALVMKDMQIEELKRDINREYGFMGMLGASAAMKKVFEQIGNAAWSGAPVMIYGESGTGKELVASATHRLSGRSKGPFVKVNCAALNESLLESELFGHKRGSFTGALRDRKGRFEAASGGTIFLDEIGDMPLSMQVKLLRVLEQKEVERVGDNIPVKVDIRLVTATNKNIYELVDAGAFREDLLYRVNVVPIDIPPLRERVEDLPLIVAHYLKRVSYVNNKEIRSVNPRAMEILKAYHWPGNIRQLINTLEYSAITCKETSIDVSDLPDYIFSDRGQPRARKSTDREAVAEALERSGGNKTLAAKSLGISRVTLWKRMKEMGLN